MWSECDVSIVLYLVTWTGSGTLRAVTRKDCLGQSAGSMVGGWSGRDTVYSNVHGLVGEGAMLHVHYKINWLLDICIDKTHQKRTTQTQLERKGVETVSRNLESIASFQSIKLPC